MGGRVGINAGAATGGGIGKGGASSMVAGTRAVSARVVFAVVRFEPVTRFLPAARVAPGADDSAVFGG